MKFTNSICLLAVALAGDYGHAFSVGISTNHARASKTQLFMSEKTRVVVTGLGVVSGCGMGHEAFFQACIDGTSSVSTVKRFDASFYPCQIASEVPDEMFNPGDFFVNAKNVKSNDRFTHFAVAAARMALKDANIPDEPSSLPNPERIGVMVGSAFGGMETFEKETLKLAARPDRPKVRTISTMPGIATVRTVFRFVSHDASYTGIPLHHPCTLG
jgi:3-oxoacyl-(acyl-carrier-protein) synthase